MTAIEEFVIDKMSSYAAGGMKPENAAKFTRGEISAIYLGNHFNRDTSGAVRLTPPPEAIPIELAMRKADAAIAEILKCCADDAKKAPEKPIQKELTGFEKMAEYARNPA
jgi:hypothetical protein